MRRAPGTGGIFRPSWRTPAGEARRGRLYWISYKVPGEPGSRREPTGSADKRQAEAILRQRLALLDRGEVPATSRTTWDQLAALIRADYAAHGRKSGARLELSLRHLGRAFAGQRAETVTAERLSGYVARRLGAGAARATVNRELEALKRAFRLGHRFGRVAAVPYIEMLNVQNARTGFFERPAFDKLLRALPADLRPPVVVAYVTGWRLASELLTRQPRHLSLARRGWLRLERGETKSGKGRVFPLNIPELRAAIAAQRKTTAALERRLGRIIPWLFHDAAGEPHFYRGKNGVMVTDYVRDAWAAACEKAGAPGAIRHDFRRTAARDLLRAGNSLAVVMKLVGWDSVAMAIRYGVVEEQDLIEAGKRRARLR